MTDVTTNNPQMRKGFTMIELIFVIVIIGILAAVAVPRLAATRDDAKVAACSQDIGILLQDLSTYYTSQGNFSTTMTDMTSVELGESEVVAANGSAGDYSYYCDDPAGKTEAVNIKFGQVDVDGYKRPQITLKAKTDVAGVNVDGDLGAMLKVKNIANATGVAHAIGGIRIKR